MTSYVLTIGRYGRKQFTEVSKLEGVNASKLGGVAAEEHLKKGLIILPHIDYAYRVQSNLVLKAIEYSLYVLDGATGTTLTLPTAIERGTEVTFVNPTKGVFVISGNGIKIVKSGVEYTSISLSEYQSIKLRYLDVGSEHPSLWYESVAIPVGVGGYTHPSTHPATMIEQDATHRFITDTILTAIHAPGSDNQDLSGLVAKVTGKALSTNDLTDTLKQNYDSAYDHSQSAHATTYIHPENHAPSIIAQDTGNRFVSDAQIASFLDSHTWKSGIATKNITDASTTQTIAHGLGRVPKFVRIDGAVIVSAAITQMCTGVFTSSGNQGLSVCIGEGTSTAATDAVYTSTSIALGFSPLVATNVFTGANRQTGIISVDATNITITWTKTGTVASLTASLLWQAY